MEITCSNFNTILPEIEMAIKNSLFVSIDCELSGLNIVRNINAFDTPKEYYKKMVANSKDFLVMQYGLSTFRYDSEENNFKQRSYNFYTFRRPINRNIPDNRFLCQSSSIDFLINHSFDFNKLFKEGVPYLSEIEADKYRINVDQSYQKVLETIEDNQNGVGQSNERIPIPDNAQQFIEDVKNQIDDFLKSDKTELQLPKCNAFFRRLVYQTKESDYFGNISLNTRQVEKDRVLFVTRLKTPEEEKQLAKKNYEEQLRELDDFIGFTKVLKSIIKSDKLIVGHNLCLDFFHTIDKFLMPLPESYEEFKHMGHSLFSRVIDTKYMSSNGPFKDLISSTVLGQLLETVSKKPFGLPEIVNEEDGRSYTIEDSKEHEAGYDAFITGLCFLGMWKHLGLLDNRSDSKTFHSMDILEPYMNRLFLMSLTDNQYIHLAGDDFHPSRDHVFYLRFPKEWKLSNIQQLFSPFGNIFVSWIDDMSAYIALYKRDQAKIVYTTLRNGDGYSLLTFAARQAQLSLANGLSVSSPGPSKKRKSPDSPTPNTIKRADNSAINCALSKMSIKPETMMLEIDGNSTKSKVFQEDDNWM